MWRTNSSNQHKQDEPIVVHMPKLVPWSHSISHNHEQHNSNLVGKRRISVLTTTTEKIPID